MARLAPLKAGRAQVSAMGVGIYYAQEGVLEFAVREWGPQPLMLILSSIDCNGSALGIAKDVGVSTYKDLKGKRVGWVVGSPALNQNITLGGSFLGDTIFERGIIDRTADSTNGPQFDFEEIQLAGVRVQSGSRITDFPALPRRHDVASAFALRPGSRAKYEEAARIPLKNASED